MNQNKLEHSMIVDRIRKALREAHFDSREGPELRYRLESFLGKMVIEDPSGVQALNRRRDFSDKELRNRIGEGERLLAQVERYVKATKFTIAPTGSARSKRRQPVPARKAPASPGSLGTLRDLFAPGRV